MQRKNELTGSCAIDTTGAGAVRNPIDSVVRALSAGFKGGQWASHIEPVPIPSKIEIIDLIEQAQRILFPGFFSPVILRPENLDYHLRFSVCRPTPRKHSTRWRKPWLRPNRPHRRGFLPA